MSEIKREKGKLSNNLSEESQTAKYVDIFTHLKINMQNNSINCKCDTDDKFYCIPCKVTCCSLCSLELHEPHVLLNMKENRLDINKINQIFTNFYNNIKKSELISGTKEFKKKMNNKIDTFVDEIIEKLNKFRTIKKREIEVIFTKLEKNIELMNKDINNINKNICDYINKNKKFFNLNKPGIVNPEANKDINNTYFLVGYDILSLTHKGMNQIYKTIDTMEEDLEQYLTSQEEDFTKIRDEIDKLLQADLTMENLEKSNIENNININTNQNSKSTPKKKSSSKKKKKEKTEKEEEEEKEKEKEDFIPNLNTFSGHIIHTSNELGQEHFIPVIERIIKYNKHIENFKKGIFKVLTKGNIKEIENSIKSYENRNLKGADSLFSQRDIGQGVKNESNTQSNFNQKKSKKLNSENDVCLNNPLVERYFNYLFLDLYDKNFKIISKELQSSHADLLIKVNEDEDDNDLGKVIEGTNEIQIYEKKSNKMYKIPLKLTKNPFGYTKFPIGCRCLLIGDKLYISGGRDEYNEYPNVLIFDRKNKSLKRIMDMRVPRAYHTMVYSEVFNSIIVFGGENEPSVEIFDPITNRWQLLPELNIPRSNIIYYCDNPRGILYTMFGNEGSILDNKYSDIIEFLDLKNIKDGWNILDYKNKSEIDLKTLMNIYPLNTDLILFYGGVVFRGNGRSVCLFNIAKSEIIKIQPKILETLRNEAKKSKKLSTIISGLTSKSQTDIISSSSSRANF